jgi:hypothetical protein
MKYAKFKLCLEDYAGDAKLYELSSPLENHSSVVVISVPKTSYTDDQTLIFGADNSGHVLDWVELPGSYTSGMSQEYALNDAGYDVIYNQ